MALNDYQQQAAKAIVNIFETGRLKGDYGRVTVAADDPGHLSYGRSQTTLASGNLFLLIHQYCTAPNARLGTRLSPFLNRLRDRDLTLDTDLELKAILAEAGSDPVMQQVQNQFFDASYWQPANRLATGLNLTSALGLTTVYDSVIHGSFQRIKASTQASFQGGAAPSEKEWIARYLALRHAWLANHPNLLLRRTVYRMTTLQELTTQNKWALEAPLKIRGIEITEQSFEPASADAQGEAPAQASAHDPNQVVLMLRVPFMRGPAVKFLQEALVRKQLLPADEVDGVFGPMIAELVKRFQKMSNLDADGVVGVETWTVVNEVMTA
jgi:chitosanase